MSRRVRLRATLGGALKNLEELARYDARFQAPAQQLAAAKAIVEDVDAEVRDFADNINAAPGRLEEIEDRLAALDRLKRKYGQTLAEVIAFGAEAARKLAEIENRDALVVELKAKEAQDAAAYRAAATQLSAGRAEAAKKLEKLAEAQINDLAMSTRFRIQGDFGPDAFELDGAWVGPGGVSDCDECGRAAEAAA